MTREILMAELLEMQKQALQAVKSIGKILCNLSTEQDTLCRVVDEYSAKRIELLNEEFRVREITWCTRCMSVLSESEAGLLLLEGREEYSHGYENSCYSFRGFFKLHRACPKCREIAFDRHGVRGPYDSTLKDQSIFYAFCVEKHEDGYYASKFGTWVKLDEEKCRLPELPSELVERLADKWNLPPRIEVESRWPNPEAKLIIHERVVAVA